MRAQQRAATKPRLDAPPRGTARGRCGAAPGGQAGGGGLKRRGPASGCSPSRPALAASLGSAAGRRAPPLPAQRRPALPCPAQPAARAHQAAAAPRGQRKPLAHRARRGHPARAPPPRASEHVQSAPPALGARPPLPAAIPSPPVPTAPSGCSCSPGGGGGGGAASLCGSPDGRLRGAAHQHGRAREGTPAQQPGPAPPRLYSRPRAAPAAGRRAHGPASGCHGDAAPPQVAGRHWLAPPGRLGSPSPARAAGSGRRRCHSRGRAAGEPLPQVAFCPTLAERRTMRARSSVLAAPGKPRAPRCLPLIKQGQLLAREHGAPQTPAPLREGAAVRVCVKGRSRVTQGPACPSRRAPPSPPRLQGTKRPPRTRAQSALRSQAGTSVAPASDPPPRRLQDCSASPPCWRGGGRRMLSRPGLPTAAWTRVVPAAGRREATLGRRRPLEARSRPASRAAPPPPPPPEPGSACPALPCPAAAPQAGPGPAACAEGAPAPSQAERRPQASLQRLPQEANRIGQDGARAGHGRTAWQGLSVRKGAGAFTQGKLTRARPPPHPPSVCVTEPHPGTAPAFLSRARPFAVSEARLATCCSGTRGPRQSRPISAKAPRGGAGAAQGEQAFPGGGARFSLLPPPGSLEHRSRAPACAPSPNPALTAAPHSRRAVSASAPGLLNGAATVSNASRGAL